MLIAKRFVGQNSFPVATAMGSAPLPGGLVIDPGIYVFNGVAYDCTQEGRYLFWDPSLGGPAQRRIVYSTDVRTLMSSLSSAACIGALDDSLSVGQVTNAAINRRPQILCGNTSIWVKGICDSLGNNGFQPVTTREVETLTAQTQTGYFDGHAMIEVMVNGAWQLFDVAAGIDFGGLALKDAIPLQSPVVRGLRKTFATSQLTSALFDCDAWGEGTLGEGLVSADADFASEFMRVLQVPGIIGSDGKVRCYIPTGMESGQAYVTSVGWIIEPKAQWMTENYG